MIPINRMGAPHHQPPVIPPASGQAASPHAPIHRKNGCLTTVPASLRFPPPLTSRQHNPHCDLPSAALRFVTHNPDCPGALPLPAPSGDRHAALP